MSSAWTPADIADLIKAQRRQADALERIADRLPGIERQIGKGLAAITGTQQKTEPAPPSLDEAYKFIAAYGFRSGGTPDRLAVILEDDEVLQSAIDTARKATDATGDPRMASKLSVCIRRLIDQGRPVQ